LDLFKLLKSLEEFLYEVIVLLVFYPRTMWLSLRYPQRMMDYADTELGDVQSGQYIDTVSPPLFLMITLGLTYLFGLMVQPPSAAQDVPSLLSDPERMLVFRVFAFSLLPLILSLRLMHDLSITLDRDTLRPPFFSQCFITAPFALGIGIGLSLAVYSGPDGVVPGMIILAVSTGWYVRQQAYWFATKRGTGLRRGWTTALSTFVLGWAAIIALVLAIGAVSR
jgi:hypothetical protein